MFWQKKIIDVMDKKDLFFEFVFGFVMGLAVALFIVWGVTYDTPKPIDVYRGKTTLQITYRDSIAIDSVVVFK